MPNELEMYKRLLTMRRAEELLARLYRMQQQMKTPTHLSVGQEAVSVGVCAALDLSKDVCFTHHRSHAAYLGCGGSFQALAAELYGRETGCSMGRGGSVHLTARDHGFVASSAILGQMVAVAAGAALSFKMDKRDSVSVCFFGEGACEEGVFWETINYAALNKLPVMFVCENNLYATESPLSVRVPMDTSLTDRVQQFGIMPIKVDGNDVDAVYGAAKRARELAILKIPSFIECSTYRWLEHVGPNYDHEAGRTYRSQFELESWQRKCPIKRKRERLIAGGTSANELDKIEASITNELSLAASLAHAATMPKPETMMENVW